jgi:isocitrate/isopropylmalate dehydrogenase
MLNNVCGDVESFRFAKILLQDFGIANPIGQICSGALMLRHLGAIGAANAIEDAIAATLAEGSARTPDIGGSASTADLGEAIAAQLRKSKSKRRPA